jgi:hypothetical protein
MQDQLSPLKCII